MAFIDAHRDRFGVEPICVVLCGHGVGISPSAYDAARTRQPSARAVRDALLCGVIARVHAENYPAYGAAKVWDHLNNVEGIRVARCTTERLMRQLGLQGVRRGRQAVRTTIADADACRPADLVKRDFAASAPNRLWLADLTYVRTHSGWVYAAFVIDAYSRTVIGWQASVSLRTGLALDALEMAVFARRRAGKDLAGLTHHSDMGAQLSLNPPVWWVCVGCRVREKGLLICDDCDVRSNIRLKNRRHFLCLHHRAVRTGSQRPLTMRAWWPTRA